MSIRTLIMDSEPGFLICGILLFGFEVVVHIFAIDGLFHHFHLLGR